MLQTVQMNGAVRSADESENEDKLVIDTSTPAAAKNNSTEINQNTGVKKSEFLDPNDFIKPEIKTENGYPNGGQPGAIKKSSDPYYWAATRQLNSKLKKVI